ncbi:hypothetical protein RhiLY_06343 [Ceratobasidium sp. AG-Ba]|nr:hypothetical protein RhiLY_06343 [Ceratobasidium sp. AG-Ba]
MGCLPSRHEIQGFKEKRRESMRERRLSRGYSDKDMYLAPPPRRDEPHSGASSPGGLWTEDDTYIPRINPTLPRLR